MPSTYLQSADYAAYSVPNATAAQVTQSSILIDAYLRRPHGLIYVADANGYAAYMQALTPNMTLTATAGFSAGAGVTVPVSGPLNMIFPGDCVVLDRGLPTMEAVQVVSVDPTGKVTLGSTAANAQGMIFNHLSGCTMDFGLIINEQRSTPKDRSIVRLSNCPVARVIGGVGRYAYGRRGDAAGYNMDEFNLLASITKFGGPPAWEVWPASSINGVNPDTGEVWVPAGIMMAYYSDVKISYVTGFTYANLPSEIKLACASLVTAFANSLIPAMGDVSRYRAGDTEVDQITSSVISADVKAMLQPWRARVFG